MKQGLLITLLLFVSACDSQRKAEEKAAAAETQLSSAPTPEEAAFIQKLPSMNVESVYYIDPYPDANPNSEKAPVRKVIDRYPIISSATLSSEHPSSEKLKSSLIVIMHSSLEAAVGCFDPHHAITLRNGNERFDLVICFECASYQIYSEKGDFIVGDYFRASEEEAWDAAFAAAGLKRVQYATAR